MENEGDASFGLVSFLSRFHLLNLHHNVSAATFPRLRVLHTDAPKLPRRMNFKQRSSLERNQELHQANRFNSLNSKFPSGDVSKHHTAHVYCLNCFSFSQMKKLTDLFFQLNFLGCNNLLCCSSKFDLGSKVFTHKQDL